MAIGSAGVGEIVTICCGVEAAAIASPFAPYVPKSTTEGTPDPPITLGVGCCCCVAVSADGVNQAMSFITETGNEVGAIATTEDGL